MASLTHRNRHELLEEAFDDVCIDTGTWYPCTQYSLDVTGGLNRQAGAMHPAALRNLWFEHGNPGWVLLELIFPYSQYLAHFTSK